MVAVLPVITLSFVRGEFVSSCCLICPGIFFPFLHTERLISFLLSNERVFIFILQCLPEAFIAKLD